MTTNSSSTSSAQGDDAEIVRRLLSVWGSWTQPTDDEYVGKVTARMAVLRGEHPDGDYPLPEHGLEERGACVECDARAALWCVIYRP